MDRLDAMKVLLAVVDAGSISGGSRALGAPLPSISRKVAELERFLGTRLLVRTSRSVQLTDAGRDYVHAARRIIADLEEAERCAAGEYAAPRGELTVTMPIEFGRRYVLPIALAFLEAHPDITLSFLSADHPLNLVEQHVDVGVRLGTLADSGLYAVRVGEFRMVTCASPAYLARRGRPDSVAALADHDAVVFAGLANSWWDYTPGERPPGPQPRARVRANTAAAAIDAAVAGNGIFRTLDFLVADQLRDGRLEVVLPDEVHHPLPVHLIYPNQGLLPLKVRAFLDWTAPRLRAELHRLRDLGRS